MVLSFFPLHPVFFSPLVQSSPLQSLPLLPCHSCISMCVCAFRYIHTRVCVFKHAALFCSLHSNQHLVLLVPMVGFVPASGNVKGTSGEGSCLLGKPPAGPLSVCKRGRAEWSRRLHSIYWGRLFFYILHILFLLWICFQRSLETSRCENHVVKTRFFFFFFLLIEMWLIWMILPLQDPLATSPPLQKEGEKRMSEAK